MRIESVQTGQPRTVGVAGATESIDREWTSAIWKDPVHGRVWAGREGLSGDAQVWRTSHGGPERALLLYAIEHYPKWRGEWGTKEIGPGGFGENLTLSGLDESTTCVGDVFQLAEVKIEISGPRGPCRNLVRRHQRRDLMERVVATGRSGWYARVQTEGWLEAGVEMILLDRPFPQWPIDRVAAVNRERKNTPTEATLLAGCPALLFDWRRKLGA